MLTLYIRDNCKYSRAALDAGEELGIAFNLKHIEDEEVARELEERGGEVQVPYLIDEEGGVELYESDAIVQYLHHRFGKDGVG
jgi:glutathione S-transferase